MLHIGQMIKDAMKASGFTIKDAYTAMGKGRTTVQAWLDTPNLTLAQVLAFQNALPSLYLRHVFEALEERLGHEIPNNPYRKKPQEEDQQQKLEQNTGIRIKVEFDTEMYAGYIIPADLTERVRQIIEDENEKYRKARKGTSS